ncbi:MAG: ABC transporter permease [Deltaproteobacteria bacterium]|nr:MAG: ABC transporter permease [Deltaproteobacteria bacterium]
MRTTPTPLGVIVLAKLSARFAIGLAQMCVLFTVGRAAFGVSLGRAPWALVLPTAGIVFAGTAFGLVVAGVTQSREAVLPIGSIAILTMAAMGGCWWPLDLEPHWMQRAALLFPTTWAMDAYNDLMIRRQPAPTVLAATAVLAGFGVIYLTIGLILFRYRLRRAP